MFRQDGSCPALLEDAYAGFPYGAVTRSGPPFQTVRVPNTRATGLVRFRSPLLAESRLMSFPPATEMFQFAGFASLAYVFSQGYRLRGGLPHSEIPGSTIARISPGLFAACHVLHRLSVPRHPPDALHSRLSATPNGKNHKGREPGTRTRAATPDARHRPPMPQVQQTLLSEDTTGSHRQPPGRQASRPPAVSRLGHTTRFFTICHQQRPRAPATEPPGTNSLPLPRFWDHAHPTSGFSDIGALQHRGLSNTGALGVGSANPCRPRRHLRRRQWWR
jgi:hypothetical protein